MINVFLRAILSYFDKVRNLILPDQNSSFYIFCVFVDGRRGSILTYFDKARFVICANQNRVRSIFLVFVDNKGRGTPA